MYPQTTRKPNQLIPTVRGIVDLLNQKPVMSVTCEYCDGKYVSTDSLRRHKQKFHKRELEEEELEDEEQEDEEEDDDNDDGNDDDGNGDDDVDGDDDGGNDGEEEDRHNAEVEVISDVITKAVEGMEGIATVRDMIDNYDQVQKAFKTQVCVVAELSQANLKQRSAA